MANGLGSTLIVHPFGLSDLVMDLTVGAAINGDTPYVVPLQTLVLNEDKRQTIAYDEEAEKAVGVTAGLVDLRFNVVILSTTRDGVIQAYNDLQTALLNPKGGTIEYKPDDLAVSVPSTHYHYVQSAPPQVLDAAGNRWDAAISSQDGMFALELSVTFRTHPVATALSPVAVLSSATIQNWLGGEDVNYVEIDGADILGTLPALVRWRIAPGGAQALGRVIMFSRNEGTLANLRPTLYAEDAVVIGSDAWELEDIVQVCKPTAGYNGVPQGLRFTIGDPGDHCGRFAVFGYGYSAVGSWTHQVKLRVGNIVQTGRADYKSTVLASWNLIYAGEFELPVTELSDDETGYDEGPYLEWYSQRSRGESDFGLLGVVLVFVSDSNWQPTALDVMCEDGGGVVTGDELLVENLLDTYGAIRELAHVVDSSSGYFKRALMVAPRGDFLMLEPGKEHRVFFVQERLGGVTILDDNFESYKGVRWLPIAEFESDEAWVAEPLSGVVAADTTHYVEGTRAIIGTTSGTENTLYAIADKVVDLSRGGKFSVSDFIVFYLEILTAASTAGALFLYTTLLEETLYGYTAYTGALSVGKNYPAVVKSDFDELGASGWDHIIALGILEVSGASDGQSVWDALRMEKADPDNDSVPNATGLVWDFQPDSGIWTITEDIMDAGATLACLDIEAAVEKTALIAATTPDDVRFRARVMAKRDVGKVGIVWRAGQDTLTAGAEDCYAAILDVDAQTLSIIEYAGGTPSVLDSEAFVCSVDVWYVIGVTVIGTDFYVCVAPLSSLTGDDDVFEDTLLVVTDATLASGQCGVMSIGTLGRFDRVKVVSLLDKFDPSDEITVEAEALFRTIAPFAESEPIPVGPVTPVLDRFDRPDTEDPPPSADWTNFTDGAGLMVSGGKCAPDGSSGVGYWNRFVAARCEVYLTITSISDAGGVELMARNDGTASPFGSGQTGYYLLIIRDDVGGDTVQLLAGAGLVTTVNVDLSAWDRFMLRCDGNTITAAYCPVGETAWTPIISVTDANFPDAGYIGVLMTGGSDIRAGDFGGGALP